MQFKQKQIVLAVGAAVAAVTAGSAVAATAVPSLRTNGVVVVNNGAADKSVFYGAGEIVSKTKVKLYLQGSDVSTNATWYADSTGPGKKLNIGVGAVTNSGLRLYVKDSAGSAVAIDSISPLDTIDSGTDLADSVGGQASVTWTFSAGSGLFKIDSAGKLLYASDSAAASPTFSAVYVKQVDTNRGFYDDTANGSAGTAWYVLPETAIVAGHTLAPTPKTTTRDADSNGVVDGVSIDFYTPVTIAATNFKIRVTDSNGSAMGTNGYALADSIGSTVTLTPGSTTASATNTISFDPTAVNWSKGDSAADLAYSPQILNTGIANGTAPFSLRLDTAAVSAVYSALVVESTGSASVKLLDSAGNDSAGAYNDAAGTTKGARWVLDTTMTDGARPIVRSATYESGTNAATKKLYINFSEKVASIVATVQADDADTVADTFTDANVAEFLQNISFGSSKTTLAAANFNENLAVDDVTADNGAGAMTDTTIGWAINANTESVAGAQLTLTKVSASVLNQPLHIAKRITLGEPTDTSYAGVSDSLGTANGLDSAGGLKSFAGEVVYSDGAVNVLTHAASLAFDACGVTAVLDSNNAVSRVDKTCSYTLGVDSAASLADHFKVTVTDGNTAPDTNSAITPSSTSVFLASGVTVSGSTISVTLPTALQRKHMTKLNIQYNPAWGDGKNYLKFQSDTAGTMKAVAGGTDTLDATSLPYYVVTGKAPLFSADMTGTLSGFTDDAKVTSYLAKWIDAQVTNANGYSGSGVKLTAGRVTNPGDKVATDLALEIENSFDSTTSATDSTATGDTTTGALSYLVSQQLNKDKPGKITVYVELMRSNDAVKKGGADTGDGLAEQDWLQAHAKISASRAKAQTANKAGEQDPVYEVTLDPVTGKIDGRLTGQLTISATKDIFIDAAGNKTTAKSFKQGLAFVRSDGTLDSASSNGASVTKSMKGGTAFNVLLGIDAPYERANTLKDVFVLSVLERPGKTAQLVTSGDPGAANFVSWMPNILDKADAPKGRYNAVGLVDSAGTYSALDIGKLVENTLDTGGATTWQLVGVGDLNRNAKAPTLNDKDFTKQFVTLDGNGKPLSSFAYDGNQDMALTMNANTVGVVAEGLAGVIAGKGVGTTDVKRYAFAWANGGASQKIWHLTKTGASGASTALKAGWSLVSAGSSLPTPCSSSVLNNCVSHLLVVGAKHGAVSWVTSDGAMPTIAAGTPVFMFTKGAVTN